MVLKRVCPNDLDNLEKLNTMFSDIRFHMGKSVLEGMMGNVYADNLKNPKFGLIDIRSYNFISGSIKKGTLRAIMGCGMKDKSWIPSDDLKRLIESIYGNAMQKSERYSLKKSPKFDYGKLQANINKLPQGFCLYRINDALVRKIKSGDFINITDNYAEHGIGCAVISDGEIVGVASSNIIYRDGIEVNIKVAKEYRRKGLATAMGSKLILMCRDADKYISWDAANCGSLSLAEKLGFEYDSVYNVYHFK
jgi:GNAT superfamily N-acetyltransferase